MLNAVVFFSGLKYLQSLAGLGDNLNEFFVANSMIDLVPMDVKAGVMRRGFKRLMVILVCYVAASISMGFLAYFLLNELVEKQGLNLEPWR